MSLEARLNHAFDRATRGANTSSEVVLANLIAAHHHHRRQRAIWLATAAVTAAVILTASDGAAEWIRSMEPDIAPVEDGAEAEERLYDQLGDEDTTRGLNGRLGADDGSGHAWFSTGSGRRVERSSSIDGDVGRTLAVGDETGDDRSVPGHEPASSGSRSRPDLTRIREKKWSTSPLGTEGPTTSFWARRNERHIDVELHVTGGGGFGSPIMGEVYEIVGGVSQLLATFCGNSGLLDVTPGSRIEVRARGESCDGSGVYLKGIARMLFYR